MYKRKMYINVTKEEIVPLWFWQPGSGRLQTLARLHFPAPVRGPCSEGSPGSLEAWKLVAVATGDLFLISSMINLTEEPSISSKGLLIVQAASHIGQTIASSLCIQLSACDLGPAEVLGSWTMAPLPLRLIRPRVRYLTRWWTLPSTHAVHVCMEMSAVVWGSVVIASCWGGDIWRSDVLDVTGLAFCPQSYLQTL